MHSVNIDAGNQKKVECYNTYGTSVINPVDDWIVNVRWSGMVEIFSEGVLIMTIDIQDMTVKLAQD